MMILKLTRIVTLLQLCSANGHAENSPPFVRDLLRAKPILAAAVAPASQPHVVVIQPTKTVESPAPVPAKAAPAPAQEAPLKAYMSKVHNLSKDTMDFYAKNDYAPVWYPNGQRTQAANIALQVLQNCYEDGLNPGDYSKATAADPAQDWMLAELTLTNEFMKYIEHIRVGRVPAGSVARTIKVKSPGTHAVDLLTDALKDQGHNFAKLTDIGPDVHDYVSLKALLKNYRVLAKNYPNLPSVKKLKLKQGSVDADVVHLRKILYVHGYLKTLTDSKTFDGELASALKAFQRNHCFEPDGIVGSETMRELNRPLSDYVNKIVVNMERLRWLPDEMGDKYILVNVGGYEVQAVTDNKVDLRIKAIVGKKSTRTPLFYAKLKNVIVNPSWGVPTSILIRSKIPTLARDPGYADRAGFSVYDSSGMRVSPYEVDWENEGARMTLRQSPGAHNALGRIKLNIENPYTIYLHGTPEDKLFLKAARNFSSGCVRLQKPTELAAWSLKGVKGTGVEDLTNKIEAGATTTINPKTTLPVYFTYLTAWVDEEGISHYSPDVYDMDPVLMKLLGLSSDQPREEASNVNYRIRVG